MTHLAKIKRLYLWKPSICKTFWTTLVCVWKTDYAEIFKKTSFIFEYVLFYSIQKCRILFEIDRKQHAHFRLHTDTDVGYLLENQPLENCLLGS